MKVDKHKYYDVFLGAINSSFERFSMIFQVDARELCRSQFLSFYGSQQVISQRIERAKGKERFFCSVL
jgi:hypothetical protein